MLARTLAVALVLAGTAAAYAATDDELKSQIVGRWGENAECTGSVLTFNADGSFTMSNDGTENGAGTYTIAGGKLNGTTPQGPMPEVAPSIADGKLTLAGDGTNDALTRCP